MTNIYLIRHAEAEGNLCRRVQGICDGQVTTLGRRQIDALAERFRDIKIDALYASDLRRAMATAEALARTHRLPIVPEPRLREVAMGVWEDKTWGEVEYESPEMLLYFNRDPEKWRVEGAEPFADTQARMQNVLLELAERHEGGTIAAVSHGMAIRSLLCAVLGIPSAEVTRIPHADNTAVSLLRAERGVLSVEYYNDNSHLPEELSTFARQLWWKLNMDRDITSLRFEPLDLERDGDFYLDCYEDSWIYAHGTTKGFERARYYEAALRRHSEPETLLRALRGEETVGILELDRVRGADEGAGWVSLCYIVPQLRGQRYGVQLLGQAAAYFRRHGRRSLRLTVAEDNVRALGFYLHYGFAEIGRAEGALGELIVMEKEL